MCIKIYLTKFKLFHKVYYYSQAVPLKVSRMCCAANQCNVSKFGNMYFVGVSVFFSMR